MQTFLHGRDMITTQEWSIADVNTVAAIARAVEHVITQPIEVNIEEIVIRPQKSLPI